MDYKTDAYIHYGLIDSKTDTGLKLELIISKQPFASFQLSVLV